MPNTITLDLREARISLRNLYDKYAQELYDVTLKIDKYLGELE